VRSLRLLLTLALIIRREVMTPSKAPQDPTLINHKVCVPAAMTKWMIARHAARPLCRAHSPERPREATQTHAFTSCVGVGAALNGCFGHHLEIRG
jgi:hypothetical protein